MFAGEDHILTKIQSSEEERNIIEGEREYDKNYDSN